MMVKSISGFSKIWSFDINKRQISLLPYQRAIQLLQTVYYRMIQPILTLSEIAQQLQKQQYCKASTVASLVDVTRPLYRQKQNNYIVEVKLIDESLNRMTSNSFLVKYLTLYLISDNKQDLEFKWKIGDFLYLHKFVFNLRENVKFFAKYTAGFESLFEIKSGEIEYSQEFSVQKKLGKQNPFIDLEFISARIVELKTWLSVSFKEVFDPFLGIKIINNYCSLIEPFSMFLRVQKILENQFQKQLVMMDTLTNIFYLDLHQLGHLLFNQREWVYLRGIKQINTDFRIVFTSTGNILKLPQMFQQEYEKQANYQAIYRKTNKLNQKKETTALTYITVSDQKISRVKQLFDLQDKYQATSKKQDIILENNYVVKGAVVKFKGKIKLYHTEYQMIIHDSYLEEIPSQQKKATIQDKKLIYIFEGSLFVEDSSVVSKREILEIKLFTNDAKSTFFDEKEMDRLAKYIGHSQNKTKIQESLAYINGKLQKLLQMSSYENLASLVLEPIRSDALIFRLINTKLP